MVGIIIELPLLLSLRLWEMAWKLVLPRLILKDQEYVQISYSPNKSGYVTGINIGPSEETGEGGSERALQLKIEGWLPHQISKEKCEDIDGQVKKHHYCSKNLGVKGINQDSRESMAVGTINATIAFQRKSSKG